MLYLLSNKCKFETMDFSCPMYKFWTHVFHTYIKVAHYSNSFTGKKPELNAIGKFEAVSWPQSSYNCEKNWIFIYLKLNNTIKLFTNTKNQQCKLNKRVTETLNGITSRGDQFVKLFGRRGIMQLDHQGYAVFLNKKRAENIPGGI